MDSLTAANRQDGTVALATLGEVLSAYTTISEASGRGRAQHAADDRLPWRGPITTAAAGCDERPDQKLPEPSTARSGAAKAPAGPRRRRSLCKCGKCGICKDNARWERIFQEKFADPEYYRQPLRIRFSSPLSRS